MSEFDDGWTRQRPDGWETDGDNLEPTGEIAQPSSGFLDRMNKTEFVLSAGLVAVVGALAYGSIHKGKNIVNDMRAKQPPAPLVASCLQPSDKSVNTVERLFTEPVAKARAEYRQLPLTGYQKEGDMMLPNLFGTPGEELLYYTKSYFNKYKIEVEVASAADKPIYGLRAPTEQELDSAYMSNNVLGIVAGLSEAPPHYVLMSGLRKIRLVAGKNNTEFAWEEPHTLDWNINTPQPNLDGVPSEFGIALGHFTEDRLCSPDGTDSDPAFGAINNSLLSSPFPGGSSIYRSEGKTTEHVASLGDYNQGKAKASDVKVIDNRATDGLSVDKAEILALIAEPAMVASAMSPDHPVLRAKVIQTLAELYRTQPAVVRRLAVEAAHYPYTGPNANDQPAGSRHDSVPRLP